MPSRLGTQEGLRCLLSPPSLWAELHLHIFAVSLSHLEAWLSLEGPEIVTVAVAQ